MIPHHHQSTKASIPTRHTWTGTGSRSPDALTKRLSQLEAANAHLEHQLAEARSCRSMAEATARQEAEHLRKLLGDRDCELAAVMSELAVVRAAVNADGGEHSWRWWICAAIRHEKYLRSLTCMWISYCPSNH